MDHGRTGEDASAAAPPGQDRPLPAVLRRLLARAGARLHPGGTWLRSAVSHVELGRWLRARGLRLPRTVPGRAEVFDVALQQLAGVPDVLYLEFGVYRGESLAYWTQRLTDPSARFVGFDSFQGLPEAWRPDMPAGHFSTDGALPEVDDARVRLVPGWFDETLPAFRVPPHRQLVLNVDADVYDSARTVLAALEPHVVEGTLLYFDELNDSWHELRALEEFLARSGCRVEPVAASRNLSHWLFRCTSRPGAAVARAPDLR